MSALILYHVLLIHPQSRLKLVRLASDDCDPLTYWNKGWSRDQYIVKPRREGKLKSAFGIERDHLVPYTTPTANENKCVGNGHTVERVHNITNELAARPGRLLGTDRGNATEQQTDQEYANEVATHTDLLL